jgi:hypothetical protein
MAMKPLMFLLAGATLIQAMPVAASHSFRNSTMAGLRCRLSNEAQDTAMTITLEPRETVTVMGQYLDVRCEEPVLRKRWPLTDGSRLVFRRNRDGNTISAGPEAP